MDYSLLGDLQNCLQLSKCLYRNNRVVIRKSLAWKCGLHEWSWRPTASCIKEMIKERYCCYFCFRIGSSVGQIYVNISFWFSREEYEKNIHNGLCWCINLIYFMYNIRKWNNLFNTNWVCPEQGQDHSMTAGTQPLVHPEIPAAVAVA